MTKKLTSLQHPLIKHLVKLREKKEHRQESQSVVVSGIKLIEELASFNPFKVLLIEEGYTPSFFIDADQIYSVDRAILKKVTGLITPEPVAAEIALPQEGDISLVNYLLILDGISDPGNMGTLLRTAFALGWEGVLITPGSTDPFNEKALRAAKGATFKIPIKQGSWEEIVSLLQKQKWHLLAADLQGQPFLEIPQRAPLALVLGNEARGLSDSISSLELTKIAIPMDKDMESLNVASAGAILMHHLKGSR